MEILHELVAFFSVYGYIAVFLVLIACGFGIPIPEDITLVSGGVICGLTATLDVHIMVVVSLLGVILGDGTMFMLGKLLGPRIKKVPLLRGVFTEKSYKQMQEKVHRYGSRILFVARFLPGLRAPIFVTAGISRRVSYLRFLIMDGGAALISVPIWVYAGYYFAHDLDDLINWVRQSEAFVIICLVVIILVSLVVGVVKKNRVLKK
jgi:membrane protein DedA with SNARE-associated domain